MRWLGYMACMGESKGAYSFMMGKRKGRKPFGKPWHRLVDYIEVDLKELGCEGVDGIYLDQDGG